MKHTTSNATHERINITLPKRTTKLLRQVPSGQRSHLINEALQKYLKTVRRAELERDLREGALANAEEDLKIAKEWYPLEEEAARTAEAWERRQK